MTILSIDGISAYDSISRLAMLQGLREVNGQAVPYVRMFYWQPSTYNWEDERVLGQKKSHGTKKRKRDKISNLLSGQNKKLHPGTKKDKRGQKKRHLGQKKRTNGTKKKQHWDKIKNWQTGQKMDQNGQLCQQRRERGQLKHVGSTGGQPVWGRRVGAEVIKNPVFNCLVLVVYDLSTGALMAMQSTKDSSVATVGAVVQTLETWVTLMLCCTRMGNQQRNRW